MKKIFYKTKIKDIPNNLTPPGYFLLKVTIHNVHKWPGLIKKCIDLFHSELEWEDMWNEMDAEGRLELGHSLWVYFKIEDHNNPIAYIWVDDNWLYNAFIHSSRPKGHSHLFLQEVIHSIDTKKDYVEWDTDDWNLKARIWFKNVGAHKA